MKLIAVTPLPPAATGVADYSELLLTGLARATDGKIEAVSLTERRDFAFAVRTPESFPTPDECDVLLYHVGNSRHHDFVYLFLARHRGILVLHDLAVHHARFKNRRARADSSGAEPEFPIDSYFVLTSARSA